MQTLEKLNAFKEPLGYIKNETIKEFAEEAIGLMPDYFFTIPASSTGKYHPAYTSGNGGLLRHTIAAVRIAVELFRMEEYTFKPDEQDLIIVSIILHDGWKSGEVQSMYSLADHPMIAGDVLSRQKALMKMLPASMGKKVIANIRSHMGQWNTNREGQEIMPKPKTKMEKFVHLCDYLASRKCLTMEFAVEVNRQ